MYGIPVAPRLFFVAEAAYRNHYTAYTMSETRLEYLRSTGAYVQADIEREAEIAVASIAIHASVRWNTGPRSFFLSLGPAIGWLVSDRISEVESIVTPGLVYDDTGLREKTFADGDLASAFESVNRMIFSVEGGIGYEFRISPRLFLVPQVRYALPLTSVTSAYASWRIPSLRVLVNLEAQL